MKENALNSESWRQHINSVNRAVVVVTFILEIIIYFVLDKMNMIAGPKLTYFIDYMITPIGINILVYIAGKMISQKAKSERIKNYATIIALTIMCGVIAVIHNVFFVTMLIFAVPMFLTVVFGDRRLANLIFVLSLIGLSTIVLYCYTVTRESREDFFFLPSIVISAGILTIILRIVKKLISLFNQQNKQLIEMAEEAHRANKAKSDFLSMTSHEIRTPMNAIVGMSDILLKDDLTEQQKLYLQNIKTSGNTLTMIVNDLLDQSKIEAGKMDLVTAPYELREMLQDIRLIIENRIGEKPIDLIYKVDPRIPEKIAGDGLRVRQILINLLNNAVKFTDEGRIDLVISLVEESEKKMRIKFSIRDTGQGIKSSDLHRLFDAFSQVNQEKNHKVEGTGLGLTISRNFINLMGGQLDVTSEYGVGTEFFFTISQDIVEEELEEEEKEFDASGISILVVDDTRMNLMVAEGLLKHEGMIVDTADSGAKTLQKIRHKEYDIILMDYMMPEMDGVETTQKIRQWATQVEPPNEHYKSVPIIALTGTPSEDVQREFHEAGGNDFAMKPLQIKELKELLIKWL